MPATRTVSAYGRAIRSERVVVGELASRRSLLALLRSLPLAERGPWLRTFADIGDLTTAKSRKGN